MGIFRRRLPLAWLAALILVTAEARAQPAASQEDALALALALGHDALELYYKGDWARAHERFTLAEQAAHSPVFGLRIAECKRNMGDLLAAKELFASVAFEILQEDTPEPWQKARADAAAELDALVKRIPMVLIELRGAPREGALVTIDGSRIAPEALRAAIPLNPGLHRIEAQLAGRRTVVAMARLASGDEPRKLTLLLAEPRPTEVGPLREPPAGTKAPGSLVPGMIGLGAGVAGLGLGSITGVLALGKANEIKAGCQGTHCLRSDDDKARSATALATASTIGFIAGGLCAAAGVTLILLRPGGKAPSARVSLAPGAGSLSMTFGF